MMNKKIIYLAIIAALLLLVFNKQESENLLYSTYTVPHDEIERIDFFSESSIQDLKGLLEEDGRTLEFATNGGIYTPLGTPEGLYVNDGVILRSMNLEDGEGNFYLKPNGIFQIDLDGAKIVESSEFDPDFGLQHAIQSGPLLLDDSKIHPAFSEGSTNTFVRSGVGVTDDGDVIFAISNEPVNFHEFAIFFKEDLGCNDALYLDGFVSRMYIAGEREELDGDFSVIIGVSY